MHNVVKADRQSKHCARLAGMLKICGQTRQPTQMSKREVDQLLTACELGNKGLETRCRKSLGVQYAPEDDPEKQHQKAMVSQIVAATGVSQDRAKRALESAGGNADNALCMILSEREADKVKVEEKAREKAEKAARKKEHKAQEQAAEAKKTAMTIASLGASAHKMAWAQVQIEFEAQLNVWQTQAMLVAAKGGRFPSYEDTQREMQGVLHAATQDPQNATLLLEHALQNAADSGLEVCTGMMVAADGVLDAEMVAQNRRRLAGELHKVTKALEAGIPVQHNADQARELSTLVGSCALKDNSLTLKAQQLLSPGNVSI